MDYKKWHEPTKAELIEQLTLKIISLCECMSEPEVERVCTEFIDTAWALGALEEIRTNHADEGI